MKIPQMEPVYGEEEKKAVMDYMNTDAWLMEHNKTEELEKMVCDFIGTKYCSLVPNGTLSLSAALIALGVKPGDEVIVPDYTIIASATAASFIGAKPIFADIEPKAFALDVDQVRQRLTHKTKAIILVSINGRPGRDWVEIMDLAQENNIPVLEDAAQCLGSYYNVEETKVHIGTVGQVGSFSFSTSKIITMGAGGMVVTDDSEIYKEIELMKNFGREQEGVDLNVYPGIDLKFTDLQAVIGIEQFKKLPDRVKRKKEIYKLYKEQLDGVVEFVDTDLKYTVPWMNDILLRNRPDRTKLVEYLNTKGIGSRVFYPAIHSQEPFYHSDVRQYVASDISKRGLWLPSSMRLTDEQIVYVCDEVKKALQ